MTGLAPKASLWEKPVNPQGFPWMSSPKGAPLEESHPLRQMFFAYILKSNKDEGFYYGSCEDLSKRVKAHNSGKVRSTKSRRPLVIHYFEPFPSRKEANRREFF